MARGDFEKVKLSSYSDGMWDFVIELHWRHPKVHCFYSLVERFEEDNDPEAAFSEEDNFNLPSVTDRPRPDFRKVLRIVVT